MNYWQIGTGKEDRDYSQEFLSYGIAAVGRGEKEIMEKVREDDVVVLRKGVKKIVAVGIVVQHEGKYKGCADAEDEDKDWLLDFDGWELPAYCYVEWRKPTDEPEQINSRMARYTMCKVGQPEIREHADRILNENPPYLSKRDGPSPTQKVAYKEIEDFLRQKGLGSEDAKAALSTINDIRLLADHYYGFEYHHWNEVKEHEIRTFLIAPLLRALGWNQRQIKIELSPGDLGVADGRKSIDVACFSADYRPGEEEVNRENCKLIIESKRFSSGIGREAIKQAKEYAKDLPGCKVILASNGYCYRAFVRNGEEFSEKPSAYLNLRMPKRDYPLDPSVDGALKVLEYLWPPS